MAWHFWGTRRAARPGEDRAAAGTAGGATLDAGDPPVTPPPTARAPDPAPASSNEPERFDVRAEDIVKALLARIRYPDKDQEPVKDVKGDTPVFEAGERWAKNLKRLRIIGRLDLSHIRYPEPIFLHGVEPNVGLVDCLIPDGVNLVGARLGELDFRSSVIGGGVRADRLHVDGALDFAGATVDGGFALNSARIGGPFYLNGATLRGAINTRSDGDTEPKRGPALLFNRAHIDGNVIMVPLEVGAGAYKRFEAEGRVRFQGARIAGSLDCRGARFHNPGGVAIGFSSATLGSDVFFTNADDLRFETDGSVNFDSATIDGNFMCHGACFRNPGDIALKFDGARIDGSVFLTIMDSYRFEAHGLTRFVGATITGQLICGGGLFKNSNGIALNFSTAVVADSVFLNDSNDFAFRSEGEVTMSGTDIGGQLSCRGGEFINLGRAALSARGVTVGAEAIMTPAKFDGQMILSRATIDTLVISIDESSWPKPGLLFVDGMTYRALGSSRGGALGQASASWMEAWLQRQWAMPGMLVANSPPPSQPHRQLADVLRRSGQDSEANRVMFQLAKWRFYRDWSHLLSVGSWLLLFSATILISAPQWLGYVTVGLFVSTALWLLFAYFVVVIPWFLSWWGRKRVWFATWLGQLADVAAISAASDEQAYMAMQGSRVIDRFPYLTGLFTYVARGILGVTAGFGYYPLYSLFWLALLYGMNWQMAEWQHQRGLMATSVAQVGSMQGGFANIRSSLDAPERQLPGYPSFNSAVYALDVMTPIVNLGQWRYWTPISDAKRPPCVGPDESGAPAGSALCKGAALPSLSASPTIQTLAATEQFVERNGLGGVLSVFWAKPETTSRAESFQAGLESWLDTGFGQTWIWIQTLLCGLLVSIAVAGFSGLLRRLDE